MFIYVVYEVMANVVSCTTVDAGQDAQGYRKADERRTGLSDQTETSTAASDH